jgi:hypothetical protein
MATSFSSKCAPELPGITKRDIDKMVNDFSRFTIDDLDPGIRESFVND